MLAAIVCPLCGNMSFHFTQGHYCDKCVEKMDSFMESVIDRWRWWEVHNRDIYNTIFADVADSVADGQANDVVAYLEGVEREVG